MQVAFQYRGEGGGGSEREKLLLGGGGGGSEREKLLLVWDSFLQSQEIEVKYSMSSTDDIITGKRAHVMYTWSSQNCNVPVGY